MSTSRFAGPIWSLFRVVVGLLFALHGAASVFGFFGGNQGKGAVEVGQWPGWYAGVIQLVCGVLVLAGLFTTPAAVLASGSMAYAYFAVHQEQALLPMRNGGEQAALFAWAFLAIAALGAGPWSADALLRGRSKAGPVDNSAEPADDKQAAATA